MHRLHRFLLGALLTATCFIGLRTTLTAGENLIRNAGFETDADQWGLYSGKDAEGAGAALAVSNEVAHSGVNSLKLSCPIIARYSAGPMLGSAGVVKPGDRFRLSLWVRAGKDFVQKPGSHGFVVRATLRTPERVDSPEGNFYFTSPDHALRATYDESRASLGTSSVSREWKPLTVVFEIPPGVQYLGLNLFVESGSGSLFIDDVVLTKVDASVAMTPLLSKGK
ncbi:MAG: hypothetical protein WC205_06700 [Opitutaceae bacterium]|jgi:hypothetical protein